MEVSLKTFGLLGEKLSHSYSPQIHAQLGGYPYALFEKKPEEVEVFLRSGSFNGINVTIPYKKTVLPFCAELSETAKRISSVNTVLRRPDGTLYGDNTDFDGFLFLLDQSGITVSEKKVLVLGSGGSGVMVSEAMRARGAGSITVISRDGPDHYGNLWKHADADVIVNTTPVGMYPNNGVSPLTLTQFHKCTGVLDLIFNPSKTRLLLDAEALNIPCMNGLWMLVAQAKKAAELFTGRSLDNALVKTVTADIERQTKNVALIGMPGCGKSMTGRALADLTGRNFIDIDELLVFRAQKSIERIFREDGEQAFRAMEHEVLKDVSKQSGLILATGGGVVTLRENLDLLKQNSTVIFLSRPLEELSTAGRPVSQKTGVFKLAEQRLPLYRQWSTHEFACSGPENTAKQIAKALELL
jgi:shikimate dehydrogenase